MSDSELAPKIKVYIMPAGSGKTTLSKVFHDRGVVDIDDCIKSDRATELKKENKWVELANEYVINLKNWIRKNNKIETTLFLIHDPKMFSNKVRMTVAGGGKIPEEQMEKTAEQRAAVNKDWGALTTRNWNECNQEIKTRDQMFLEVLKLSNEINAKQSHGTDQLSKGDAYDRLDMVLKGKEKLLKDQHYNIISGDEEGQRTIIESQDRPRRKSKEEAEYVMQKADGNACSDSDSNKENEQQQDRLVKWNLLMMLILFSLIFVCIRYVFRTP